MDKITPREMQVLKVLAAGEDVAAACISMRISRKTWDTHRLHILKKLGLKNNVKLAHYALQYGLIDHILL